MTTDHQDSGRGTACPPAGCQPGPAHTASRGLLPMGSTAGLLPVGVVPGRAPGTFVSCLQARAGMWSALGF